MTEMSELIDEYFEDRENFSVAVEIGGFQRWLQENHPQVLRRWMAQMERAFLARAVSSRQRDRRSNAQRRKLRVAVEQSDRRVLSEFEVRCSVGPEHLWVRVGDLTAEHHRQLARAYTDRGQRSLLLGAFHREIAKRLGTRTTSEVLTEEDYARLRSSITGQPGPISLREALTSPPPELSGATD